MGYVYVLSNPAMPGLVKIGCTDRSPRDRVAELSASTGVPEPFVLEVAAFFVDHADVEQELHRSLAEYRLRDSREFFRLPTDEARRQLVDRRLEVLAREIRALDDDDCWRLIESLPPEKGGRQRQPAPAPVAVATPPPPAIVLALAPKPAAFGLNDCWQLLERRRTGASAEHINPDSREFAAIAAWILLWSDQALMRLVDVLFTRRSAVKARMGRRDGGAS
jgi:hypothetical protein